MSSLREECGVFGVYSGETSDVASTAYYGLFALQHRGQESCGIVVNDDGVFNDFKDTGLVNDVFTPEIIEQLGEGNIAVGHVRYGTTGSNDRSNAQPIVVNHIKGKMALAHNGNLINSGELRRELELEGSIFHTTSDYNKGAPYRALDRAGDKRRNEPHQGSLFAGYNVTLKAYCGAR